MIARKHAPLLFVLILSGVMSLLVSGVATVRTVGVVSELAHLWIGAWLAAWALAFPLVLLVAPLTRRLVEKLVGPA